MFVFKVMDDVDFFVILEGDKLGNGMVGEDLLRMRLSGLDMESVKKLMLFLKYLGFVFYYNMVELLVLWVLLRNLRGLSRLLMFVVMVGVGLDKVRGLVLVVMRGLYECDFWRFFLFKDYWLMMEKFDMVGFKEVVVVEVEW